MVDARLELKYGQAMDKEEDNALLSRLNALKKSSVSLGTTKYDPRAIVVPISRIIELMYKLSTLSSTSNKGSDLSERFGALKSSQSKSPGTKHEAFTEPFGVGEEDPGPPSPTLEELLAELNTEETSHTVGKDEIRDAQTLLAEAQDALRAENDKAAEPPFRHDPRTQNPRDDAESVSQGISNDDGKEDVAADDDTEAAASLRRILDEVAIENPSEGADDQESSERPTEGNDQLDQQHNNAGQATPLFPSAPTYLPPSQPAPNGMRFPSAPTALPEAAPSRKVPKFTDAEIDTWCIICLADATVRCLGCAGDLYCGLCWKEGHTGPDVGYENRRHKSEKLRRNPAGIT